MSAVIVHYQWSEENEEWFELFRDGTRIAYVTTVDRGHEVWIMELSVDPDHRGDGHGTTLLNAVLNRHGERVLALCCQPIRWPSNPDSPRRAEGRDDTRGDGMSAAALAAWYARHGFRPDLHSDRRDRRLVRMPRPPREAGLAREAVRTDLTSTLITSN